MKKLIALSVVLALFAGAGFAQITVGDVDIKLGGYLAAGATLSKGDTDNNADKAKVDGLHVARLQVDVTDKSGIFGAFIRVNANDVWYGGNAFAWGWWKPIEQVRLQLGQNPDGDFGTDFIVGWGFHGNDAEDLVAIQGYSNIPRDIVFYGGFGDAGAELSILPIPALAINLAVPYKTDDTAEYAYKHIHAQVTYGIADVGDIAVTFKGGTHKYDRNNGSADTSSFYAQFHLTMIENLGVNIGLKYSLPADGDGTYYSPVALGFGVSYDMGDFGIKARLGTTFAGKHEVESTNTTYDDGFKLGFDIMPSYNLGILKVFLNMGIEVTGDSKTNDTSNDNSLFGWYINPYVSKSVGIGTVFAGLYLGSNIGGWDTYEAGEDKLGWGIPVGITIAF